VVVELDRIFILAEPATNVEGGDSDSVQEAKSRRVRVSSFYLPSGLVFQKNLLSYVGNGYKKITFNRFLNGWSSCIFYQMFRAWCYCDSFSNTDEVICSCFYLINDIEKHSHALLWTY
jgi:hypothetical protein